MTKNVFAIILAIALVAVVAISSILYAVSRYRNSSEGYGIRELRIAVPSDITTIDISYAISVADFEVLGKVYESLFRIDYDPMKRVLIYVPWLVEKYTAVNDTYWLFTVRRGVKFHNGEPLTAWDIEASIRRALDISPIGRMLLRDAQGEPIIEDIVVYNATTFSLKLGKPFTPLIEHLAHLATAIMPRSVAERYRDGKVDKVSDVIGTGPFRLIEYVRGQYVKLQRFDEYWGKRFMIENLVYMIAPDVSARVAALKTGQVDIAVGVQPETAIQLKQEGFKVYNETGVRFVIAAINIQRIADTRIRQAMNYAVDRRSIVNNLMKGFASVAESVVSPVFPGSIRLKPYDYDLETARKLIEETGGVNRTLTLLVSTRSPKDIELAQVLQNYLSSIGIDVEIQTMEHTAFLKRVFQDHDFDLAIYGPSPSSLYYALTYWRTGAALNAPLYSNPEVDKLLDMVAREDDPKRQHDLYRRLQEIIWFDCPAVWLCFENIIIVADPDIVGLRVLPFQMLILDEVHTKG